MLRSCAATCPWRAHRSTAWTHAPAVLLASAILLLAPGTSAGPAIHSSSLGSSASSVGLPLPVSHHPPVPPVLTHAAIESLAAHPGLAAAAGSGLGSSLSPHATIELVNGLASELSRLVADQVQAQGQAEGQARSDTPRGAHSDSVQALAKMLHHLALSVPSPSSSPAALPASSSSSLHALVREELHARARQGDLGVGEVTQDPLLALLADMTATDSTAQGEVSSGSSSTSGSVDAYLEHVVSVLSGKVDCSAPYIAGGHGGGQGQVTAAAAAAAAADRQCPDYVQFAESLQILARLVREPTLPGTKAIPPLPLLSDQSVPKAGGHGGEGAGQAGKGGNGQADWAQQPSRRGSYVTGAGVAHLLARAEQYHSLQSEAQLAAHALATAAWRARMALGLGIGAVILLLVLAAWAARSQPWKALSSSFSSSVSEGVGVGVGVGGGGGEGGLLDGSGSVGEEGGAAGGRGMKGEAGRRMQAAGGKEGKPPSAKKASKADAGAGGGMSSTPSSGPPSRRPSSPPPVQGPPQPQDDSSSGNTFSTPTKPSRSPAAPTPQASSGGNTPTPPAKWGTNLISALSASERRRAVSGASAASSAALPGQLSGSGRSRAPTSGSASTPGLLVDSTGTLIKSPSLGHLPALPTPTRAGAGSSSTPPARPVAMKATPLPASPLSREQEQDSMSGEEEQEHLEEQGDRRPRGDTDTDREREERAVGAGAGLGFGGAGASLLSSSSSSSAAGGGRKKRHRNRTKGEELLFPLPMLQAQRTVATTSGGSSSGSSSLPPGQGGSGSTHRPSATSSPSDEEDPSVAPPGPEEQGGSPPPPPPPTTQTAAAQAPIPTHPSFPGVPSQGQGPGQGGRLGTAAGSGGRTLADLMAAQAAAKGAAQEPSGSILQGLLSSESLPGGGGHVRGGVYVPRAKGPTSLPHRQQQHSHQHPPATAAYSHQGGRAKGSPPATQGYAPAPLSSVEHSPGGGGGGGYLPSPGLGHHTPLGGQPYLPPSQPMYRTIRPSVQAGMASPGMTGPHAHAHLPSSLSPGPSPGSSPSLGPSFKAILIRHLFTARYLDIVACLEQGARAGHAGCVAALQLIAQRTDVPTALTYVDLLPSDVTGVRVDGASPLGMSVPMPGRATSEDAIALAMALTGDIPAHGGVGGYAALPRTSPYSDVTDAPPTPLPTPLPDHAHAHLPGGQGQQSDINRLLSTLQELSQQTSLLDVGVGEGSGSGSGRVVGVEVEEGGGMGALYGLNRDAPAFVPSLGQAQKGEAGMGMETALGRLFASSSEGGATSALPSLPLPLPSLPLPLPTALHVGGEEGGSTLHRSASGLALAQQAAMWAPPRTSYGAGAGSSSGPILVTGLHVPGPGRGGEAEEEDMAGMEDLDLGDVLRSLQHEQ